MRMTQVQRRIAIAVVLPLVLVAVLVALRLLGSPDDEAGGAVNALLVPGTSA